MKFLLNIGISAIVTLATSFGVYNYVPLDYLQSPFVITGEPKLGATITTIAGSDTISSSRAVINTNFTNLNTGKLENSDYYGTTTHAVISSLPALTSAAILNTVGTLNTLNISGDLSVAGGDFNFGTGSATTTLTVSAAAGCNTARSICLGIASTTPAELFSVHGNALIAGTTTVHTLVATSTVFIRGNATSSNAGGWNLTGGCFAINGTCLGVTTVGGTLGGGTAGTALYVDTGAVLAQTPATSVGGMNASSTAVVKGSGDDFFMIPLMTEIASNTVNVAATIITKENIPPREHLEIRFEHPAFTLDSDAMCFFNNDDAANYESMGYALGAVALSNVASTSANGVSLVQPTVKDNSAGYWVINVKNPLGRAKMFNVDGGRFKAGTVNTSHFVGVWKNTTAQITRIDCRSTGGVVFPVGTSITVYGSSQ